MFVEVAGTKFWSTIEISAFGKISTVTETEELVIFGSCVLVPLDSRLARKPWGEVFVVRDEHEFDPARGNTTASLGLGSVNSVMSTDQLSNAFSAVAKEREGFSMKEPLSKVLRKAYWRRNCCRVNDQNLLIGSMHLQVAS